MTNPAFLFADVIDKLKTTVQQGRSFDAAQVKLVGLDDIRTAAGDQWDAIKERVRTNSLDFLQGCLGREDIVIPAGDGFLVLYAEDATRDLSRESAMLQDALNAFYIGEEGMEKLRSKVKGVSVDAKNMHSVLDFQGGDLDLVDEERAPIAPPVAQRDESAVGKHHILLAPIWTVAQEVITTYFVSAAYYDNKGIRQFGHDPVYRAQAKQSGATFLDLDLLMLKTAVETADAALVSGRKSLIGFSVHSTTLRSRSLRATYLAALARTPERLRKYLTARIAEVEPGVPLITLSEWVGVLRSICARVTIELHPSEPNLQDLRATGATTVAFFLPITDAVTSEQRKHYATLLGRWTQALHKQDLLLSVAHMIDPVLIEVGRRAGVDFMSSEIVWPMVDEPPGVVKFPTSGLAAAFGLHRSA